MEKPLNKIWIIGSPGVGKTTLGKLLSDFVGIKLIELDAIYWQPDWNRLSSDEFISNTRNSLNEEKWVVAGCYDEVIDILIEKSDTIVWIDLPLLLLFWRVFKRSVVDGIKNKELWNGNKESLLRLISKNSMPLYLIKSYNEKQNCIKEIIKRANNHNIIYLKSQNDINNFLTNFKKKEVNNERLKR